MKFTLTFDGELPSTGNSSRKKQVKWAIRKTIHPQLKELCSSHRPLKGVLRDSVIPASGEFSIIQAHHSDQTEYPRQVGGPTRDLCAPIQVGLANFLPIVRESLALVCGLKILFLRKEDPGSLVLQGGDLDNRIKTLFDALRVPSETELVDDPDTENPFHCLLESDTLITACEITATC